MYLTTDELSSLLVRILCMAEPPAGPIHTLIATLKALEKTMSKLSDAIASASGSADAAIARVQADVTSLRAQVTTLQATIDAGTATDADLAKIAEIQAKLDALDPAKPATLPDAAPAPG